MRLSLNEEEQQLRDEVRSFLNEHQPEPHEIPEDYDEQVEFLCEWQRRLHAAKLVGLSWPAEFGGRGATHGAQLVVNAEMGRAGAPPLINSIGIDVIGPSLLEHGTDEQKSRFLDGILGADDIWCQGFSEVGAGSDLAALKTRVEDHGDHFVLSGHKIWTSYATHAHWCAVLARTQQDGPAHRGISYLLVDMTAPGIEARPLVQVTGAPEFGEVYFDRVEVPRENLLGELNGGWGIAMHTLAHERGWYALGRQAVLRGLLDRAIDLATCVERDGQLVMDHPEIWTALAQAHVGLEVLKHQGYRSVGSMVATGQPGFESSIDKLVLAEAEQRMANAVLDVLGPAAPLGEDSPAGDQQRIWHHTYLYARAGSVYGGSAQIQRNIIAQRILGLPR